MAQIAAPRPTQEEISRAEAQKLKYYTATQFQLMWWRFRKHRLALFGTIVLVVFLIIALFAEFIAPHDPATRNINYILGPPQRLHFVDQAGKFHLRPFVYGVHNELDPDTFELKVSEDTSRMMPLRFFVKGEPYKLWRLIRTDRHLVGVEDGFLHFLGTDELGRDLLSRILLGTRTTLSIGVIGQLIAFFLGLIIGGISGFFGGRVDDFTQRFIEFIRSIPTLPLWMALAAALPKEWPPLRVYFAITLILGFLGWTNLARRVRGKLLSLRGEDFIVAAKIAGCTNARIISRHMLPSFLSYIIVDISIAFPYMILGETSLSFIGLGLRPPVISWGVLLKAAQNVKAIALHPWLFSPVVFVVFAVLAFSFVGDGLRDAADPYSK
jgi:peptide/nickel transport system permease protein